MIKTLSIGDLVIGTYQSGFLLDKHEGFGMPTVRVDMKDRGHYHGASFGYAFYGKRALTIEGEIVGMDIDDYAEKRQLLAETFDIMKGEQTLYVETHTGLVVQMDVILGNSVELPYEKGKMVRSKFQLNLIGAKPFFEGAMLNTVDVNIFEGGGFSIPFAVALAVNVGDDTSEAIPNAGNGRVFPIITIHGACSNPTITNANTGQTLSLTRDLEAGEYVEIDTYNRTAMLNGATNITHQISGDWILLKAGSNDVRLAMTSPDETAKAVFSWRDAYIGI